METHARTLAKTLSYRILAAGITAAIAWSLTGSWSIGLALGVTDTVVKLGFFYVHERLWARVRAGYALAPGSSRAS